MEKGKQSKFLFHAPPDICDCMHKLKMKKFYDKPFSDVIRYMLRVAMQIILEEEKAREQSA